MYWNKTKRKKVSALFIFSLYFRLKISIIINPLHIVSSWAKWLFLHIFCHSITSLLLFLFLRLRHRHRWRHIFYLRNTSFILVCHQNNDCYTAAVLIQHQSRTHVDTVEMNWKQEKEWTTNERMNEFERVCVHSCSKKNYFSAVDVMTDIVEQRTFEFQKNRWEIGTKG